MMQGETQEKIQHLIWHIKSAFRIINLLKKRVLKILWKANLICYEGFDHRNQWIHW